MKNGKTHIDSEDNPQHAYTRFYSYKANVIINEQPINQVNYAKFLGLYIDEELAWKYHINHVTMKVAKMTGIMAEEKHFYLLKHYSHCTTP